MAKETLGERYGNEVLSDNTGQYEQCKNCFFKDADNYRKGVCDMYKAPSYKPSGIRKNTEECDYYQKE